MLDALRHLKHRMISLYYQFRINGGSNPYEVQFRSTPYRILFILSHMRSGSSLLTHILNSNPEIIGYGETHLNYHSEGDLKQLLLKVYSRLNSLEMNHRYAMDKVLHNHKFADDSFLTSSQVYNVFLLRNPQRVLPSILSIKPDWSQEKAFNYYSERLEQLQYYAQKINDPEHCLLITYEQLLENSTEIFEKLQTFLGTTYPFTEEYQVLKTTGMKGIGDSSENIKVGKIVKKQRQLDIDFDAYLLAKAEEKYQETHQALIPYCQS